MKHLLLIVICISTTLFCADKEETTTLIFAGNKKGTYKNEILNKAETLKHVLEDIGESNEPIPLEQLDQQTFEILYNWMKKKKDKNIIREVASKNNDETIKLLEVAKFLILPQIEEILTQRLFDLILSPGALTYFLSNPQAFLAQFNIGISPILAKKLFNTNAVQGTLLQATLGQAPSIIGTKQDPMISSMALSSGNNYLALSHTNGHVTIFDLQTKNIIKDLTPTGDATVVFTINFSPDGKELAAAYANGKIYFWDIQTDNPPRIFTSPIQYSKYPEKRSICFSRDNRYLIWTPRDTSVKIVDTTQKNPSKNLMYPHNPHAVDCSSNGYLAIGCADGIIDLLDLSDFTSVGSIKTDIKSGISTVNFSHDNTRIAIGFMNRTIKVYALTYEENKISAYELQTMQKPLGYASEIYMQSLDFSADNRWLACHEYENHADIWNIQAGNILTKIDSLVNQGSDLFSPDGTFFVSCSTPIVKIWDISITKRQLPFGVSMLINAFNQNVIPQFDKKKIRELILSLLSTIGDEKDRTLLHHYFMQRLEQASKKSVLQKIFKR